MDENRIATLVIGFIAIVLTIACVIAILADIFKDEYNAPDIVYYAPGTGLGVFISRQVIRRVRSRPPR